MQAVFFHVSCVGLLLAASSVAHSADWPSYNGTYTSDRYSELTSINTETVKGLREVCHFDTGETASFQTGPVIVDGAAYITTEFSTYAVDAATCTLRWKREVRYDPPTQLAVNRGVAYLNGKLYRGAGNGKVYALDAASGDIAWETQIADRSRGETLPSAPIAWNGKVYIAIAGGGMYSVRGRVHALDAETGKQVWTFDLVPKPGAGLPQADQSWRNTADVPRTGGGSWTSYSLDVARGHVFVPAGNPAPIFVPALRPGDNLFANSMVTLDANTGAYVSHFQVVPNDWHDWDAAAAPALVTTASRREMMIIGGKDGYLYGVDRTSNTARYKTPISHSENTEAPITAEGTRFCPGIRGGVEWNGPAYSPRTNIVYVGAVEWCTTVRAAAPQDVAKQFKIGVPWTGEPVGQGLYGKQDEHSSGTVTAIDADTGEIKWRIASPTPMVAGVLTTAGDVVITGDLNGDLIAWHARTGAELWRHATGDAIGGGVVSYTVNGRQYLAAAVGMTARLWPAKSGTAKLMVLALP